MELTKVECMVLMSMVTDSVGIEVLIGLLSEEVVAKMDAIATDLIGDTTPNEMALIAPNVLKRMADKILELNEERSVRYADPFTLRDETVELPTRLKSSE